MAKVTSDGSEPLRNGRHELFAQQMAMGRRLNDAANAAGFSYNHASAGTRMMDRPDVAARVAFLKLQLFEDRRVMFADLVRKEVLTREWVIDRLMRNATVALGDAPVKLKLRNKDTGEFEEFEVSKHDAGAANRALELLGKELGMFVDRVMEVQSAENMTDDELTAIASERRH